MTGRRDREPPGLQRWLRQLKYPPMPDIRNPAGRTLWLIGQRQTAERYARAFYIEHGRLPRGPHHPIFEPSATVTFPNRPRRSSSPR
jgi:hypothetical protein